MHNVHVNVREMKERRKKERSKQGGKNPIITAKQHSTPKHIHVHE